MKEKESKYGVKVTRELIRNPKNLTEVLESLRLRPGMYLGEASAHNLHVWLQGVICGLNFNKDFDFDLDLFEFDTFVQDHYDWHDTGGWAAKISYYHRNEYDSLEEFFRLYDKYREEKNETREPEDREGL